MKISEINSVSVWVLEGKNMSGKCLDVIDFEGLTNIDNKMLERLWMFIRHPLVNILYIDEYKKKITCVLYWESNCAYDDVHDGLLDVLSDYEALKACYEI